MTFYKVTRDVDVEAPDPVEAAHTGLYLMSAGIVDRLPILLVTDVDTGETATVNLDELP